MTGAKMKRQSALMRYYKRQMYRGRNMFARVVDFLAFRIVAFALLYIWFSQAVDNSILILLLSVVALLALCVAAQLFKSIRLERFIGAERTRLKTRLMRERFTVMSRDELYKIIREYVKAHPDDFKDGDCAAHGEDDPAKNEGPAFKKALFDQRDTTGVPHQLRQCACLVPQRQAPRYECRRLILYVRGKP